MVTDFALNARKDLRGSSKMKNKIEDLNNHLFAAIERLNDEELTEKQIKAEAIRGKSIAALASTLVASGSLSLKAQQVYDDGKIHAKPEMLQKREILRKLP